MAITLESVYSGKCLLILLERLCVYSGKTLRLFWYYFQVGDAKDPVRKGVRALFRNVCSVFPPVKLFTFVLEGLKSKNARQRTGRSSAVLVFQGRVYMCICDDNVGV